MEPHVRRRRLCWGVAVVAIALIGFVLRALGDGGETLDVVGLALVGSAGVVAVSAVFYEIGAGEDEERRRGK